MAQLAADGTMVDMEHSYGEIESVIKDFIAFIEMIQFANQEEQASESEKRLADYSCYCVIRLAEQYLTMKKDFCLCKGDEILTNEKDIQA